MQMMIDFFDEDSGNVTFCCIEMNILSVNLDNINLDNDNNSDEDDLDMYLLKCGMTWNHLKWSGTTYNKQKTIWKDLQQARSNLKQPTMSKKWLETTYNEHKTTWNNLPFARNNLKRPTTSKEQPKMTCKEQSLTSWNPSTWKITGVL